MTVLDSYALLAYLRDEVAAEQVASLLAEGECVTTATAVCEVIDLLVRLHKISDRVAAGYLAELPLREIVAIDGSTGVLAGRLRAKHYHGTRRAVSLADCMLAAVSLTRIESLASADAHLLELCRAEGIEVVALPGSDGSVWRPE